MVLFTKKLRFLYIALTKLTAQTFAIKAEVSMPQNILALATTEALSTEVIVAARLDAIRHSDVAMHYTIGMRVELTITDQDIAPSS